MISDTASVRGFISTRSSLETQKEANKFICQVKQRNLNSKGSKLYFLSWHFLNLLINLTELKNLRKVMTCILYFWYLWQDLNRTYPITNTRWTTHIKTVFVTVVLHLSVLLSALVAHYFIARCVQINALPKTTSDGLTIQEHSADPASGFLWERHHLHVVIPWLGKR